VTAAVMARVANLPAPARPRRRPFLGLAAAAAFAVTATAVMLPWAGTVGTLGRRASATSFAVARSLATAFGIAGEALLRAAGGPETLHSMGNALAATTLAGLAAITLIFLAREIRRAPSIPGSLR
jgi:hypothetical protein